MKGFIILKGNEVDVSEAPEIISILPLGHVISSKGEFNVDVESFAAMKQEIAKRGVDLVVDYEHQTLTGNRAPAAGWVKELILRDNDIAARVEWTSAAAEYLKNKEYRYLSPVVSARKTDGKAVDIHSLALTNTPAIEGLTAIVNSSTFNKEDNKTMDIIQELAKLLGLGEGATEEQVLEAIKAALSDLQALKSAGEIKTDETVVANKAVCELLDLKAGAPAADVTAKIMALKGGIIGGVNVLEQLKALQKQNDERDANDSVTMALKNGKITPAQKDWALSYALSDKAGFASFVEKAPQIVPMGSIVDGGEPPVSKKPDEATMLVCKQLGLSTEEVEKYGKE